MNRVIDWRQVARGLAPLLPMVALSVVLALNIALHKDTYTRQVPDAYIAPVITPEPLNTAATVPTTDVVRPGPVSWDRLADCESGLWNNGRPVPGTARWHIANTVHQGGLQFAVSTWDAYRPVGFPADAQLASRDQQIAVAVRVRDGVPGTRDPYLNPQGWGAWPRCSRMVGLRP